mmetsp:Transcript_79255/g.116145  ORF Transcript_79255/g.116145 Transcript_79255/m.116145 type:complete len:214 (-) Transcript_79255:824-1465(-)
MATELYSTGLKRLSFWSFHGYTLPRTSFCIRRWRSCARSWRVILWHPEWHPSLLSHGTHSLSAADPCSCSCPCTWESCAISACDSCASLSFCSSSTLSLSFRTRFSSSVADDTWSVSIPESVASLSCAWPLAAVCRVLRDALRSFSICCFIELTWSFKASTLPLSERCRFLISPRSAMRLPSRAPTAGTSSICSEIFSSFLRRSLFSFASEAT